MFVADTINFREIAMKEPLPLARIQTAVIDFLRGRTDVVLFGAQAVNVYVAEPRATQDLDLMSMEAVDLAEELRRYLSESFHIAVRVRVIKEGRGYRIFQLRKDGNRHLVDIRSVTGLPETETVDGVQVLSPPDLVASKVISCWSRRGKSKSWTDRRDIASLLQAFPDLKTHHGKVNHRLLEAKADAGVLEFWRELVDQEIIPDSDDDV
jgi:hypothetical protein